MKLYALHRSGVQRQERFIRLDDAIEHQWLLRVVHGINTEIRAVQTTTQDKRRSG